jgi:dolichyl-phosphate-mannose--protein O-mannosyl transferase
MKLITTYNTWWKSASLTEKLLFVVVFLAIFIGIFARSYHLSLPSDKIFDEVYFSDFARQLLNGKLAFDVHPPMGKYFIALGISLFGDTAFGWRIIPMLFGIISIPLFGWLAYLLRRTYSTFYPEKQAAWITPAAIMAVIALEPILIIYSRVSLMDGILLFMIFLVFGVSLWARRFADLLLLSFLLGVAVGIKWIALGVIAPVVYIMWRRKMLLEFILSVPVAVITYGAIVFSGQIYSDAANPWIGMIQWHRQAWDYHAELTAGHPWGSPWWSWPLMMRPLLMSNPLLPAGESEIMLAIGNPILWWGSAVAVYASLVYLVVKLGKKQNILDHPLMPLLMGYFAFWLPWAPIKRVLFIYHYLPAYGFAILMVGYWFAWLWHRRSEVALALLFILCLLSGAFMPLATGWLISDSYLKLLIWSRYWLYELPWPNNPLYT